MSKTCKFSPYYAREQSSHYHCWYLAGLHDSLSRPQRNCFDEQWPPRCFGRPFWRWSQTNWLAWQKRWQSPKKKAGQKCVVSPIREVSFPNQFWLILKLLKLIFQILYKNFKIRTLLLLNDWGSHDGLNYVRSRLAKKMRGQNAKLFLLSSFVNSRFATALTRDLFFEW